MPRRRKSSDWWGKDLPPLGKMVTHWSLVMAAKAETPDGKAALRRLAEDYAGPIYETLKRMGIRRPHAEDLCQAFIVRFLEGKYVQGADPELGQFRGYLKTSLKRFVYDDTDKEKLRQAKPLADEVPAGELTLDEAFDCAMVRKVLQVARAATQKRLASRSQAWEALTRYFLREPSPGKRILHRDVAAEMGMEVDAFRDALYAGINSYRAELARAVGEVCGEGETLEEGMAWFDDGLQKCKE